MSYLQSPLLRDQLRRCAVSYGDKVAFIEGQHQRTWAEVDRRTNALAAGMQNLGIGKGDVVAMLAKDHLEVIELWFACLKIGAVRVGINWRYAPREMLHLIRDSAAKLVFVEAECRQLLGTSRSWYA